MEANIIHIGDALKFLKTLPDNSIHCAVTSPPYWKLRDYKVKGQYGQEITPEKYINKLVKVFDEVKRVLTPTGTLWLNIGDSYASSAKNRTEIQAISKSTLQGNKKTQLQAIRQGNKITGNLKAKDLVGIPWMLAFALRKAGWHLRMDIIWHKPNAMPESVSDRPTKAHEYIFLLSKNAKYYYNAAAIKTNAKKPILIADADIENAPPITKTNKPDKQRGHSRRHEGFNARWDNMTKEEQQKMGANKRSVWSVATRPFKDAHYAVFPEELIIDCIKASCPEQGIVLDPFGGSGTTGLVAHELNRKFILVDINPRNKTIAINRFKKKFQLFSPF